MADIDVQRKGPSIWPWIIGLLVLALIIWAVAEMVDTDDAELAETELIEEEPAAEIQPDVLTEPEAVAPAAGISVAEIAESPTTFTGRTLDAEVRVVDVPTDRGFWIEDQGKRLFAIIIDQPREVPLDINPGQTLRISQATVRDPSSLTNLPGAPLDADTERLAREQPVFLVVDEGNIQIVGGQSGQTGQSDSI